MLLTKFSSEKANLYIHDVQSNEILQVSPALFSAVKQYGITDTESSADFSGNCDEVADDVLLTVERLRKQNILLPHYPQKSAPVIGVSLHDQSYTLNEFLSSHSRMLTLELTHRCNLDCTYCCFGKHYSRYRHHDAKAMSREIAEQAIRYHLDMSNSGRTVTFYGGEPLLEFDLLQHCVAYAERYSRETGREMPRFSLTTNGTLLTDEILHFFVEHDFSVLISLDGDKESHDRFRVFKGSGRGTFDVVEKNMLRFIELYPEYHKRGISLTLNTCSDFERSNEILKKFVKQYAVTIVNFVNPAVTPVHNCSEEKCGNTGCVKSLDPAEENGLPDFLRWTPERYGKYQDCMVRFYALLMKSPDEARKEWPLFYRQFHGRFRNVHKRTLFNSPIPRVACGCIPGAVRLYCSTKGDYFPCEKVETSESLKIGNVNIGIDASRVERMIQYMSETTDCNNCAGKHICSICPSQITESSPGEIRDSLIRETCQKHLERQPQLLQEYVSLMEINPSVFDQGSKPDTEQKDWLSEVGFLVEAHHTCRNPDCPRHNKPVSEKLSADTLAARDSVLAPSRE